MPQWIKDIAKAITGAAMAGVASASTALVGDGRIDTAEWLVIVLAILGSLYAVWQTPDSMTPMRKALDAE